jgi:thioredoxin 1
VKSDRKEKTMSNLEKATLANFEEKVFSSDIPVLVEFSTPTCPSCRTMERVLEGISEEYRGRLNLLQVDVAEEQTLGAELGITAVPTVVIFKGGEPVDGVVGAVPARALRERVDRVLETSAADACGSTG